MIGNHDIGLVLLNFLSAMHRDGPEGKYPKIETAPETGEQMQPAQTPVKQNCNEPDEQGDRKEKY